MEGDSGWFYWVNGGWVAAPHGDAVFGMASGECLSELVVCARVCVALGGSSDGFGKLGRRLLFWVWFWGFEGVVESVVSG